jgi:hypothetical protein
MIKLSLDVKQSVVFSVIIVKNINLLIDLASNQDINISALVFACSYLFYETLFCVYMMTDKLQNVNLEFFSLVGLVINAVIFGIQYFFSFELKDIKMSFINLVVYLIFYFLFITRKTKLYRVTKEDVERYGEDCVICLEEMCIKSSSNLQKLKCNHVFHKQCIKKYVGYNNHLEEVRCPTCRC